MDIKLDWTPHDPPIQGYKISYWNVLTPSIRKVIDAPSTPHIITDLPVGTYEGQIWAVCGFANEGGKINWRVEPVTKIVGVVDVQSLGSSYISGAARMTIAFSKPLPVSIKYLGGFDWNQTAAYFNDVSFQYPEPRTFPYFGTNGFNKFADTSNPPSNLKLEEIVKGVQNYQIDGVDVPAKNLGYISKIVLYDIVLPAGYELELTSARTDLVLEIR